MVNHHTGIPTGASGVRHVALGNRLRELGWSVVLIGAKSRNRDAHPTEWNGVRFRWIDVPHYTGNGVGRLTNMLAFANQVRKLHKDRELPSPDVVIGSTVHPFAASAAMSLANRFDVPFVYEIRDFWPETLIRLNALSEKNPLARLLYKLERSCWERADLIEGPLRGTPKYGRMHGLPERPFLWISNGVDLTSFPRTEHDFLNTPRTLLYAGAHGNANYLSVLVEALSTDAGRSTVGELQVVLVGDGVLKQDLMRRARELQIANLTFRNAVPRPRIPQIMSSADGFLLPVADARGLYEFGASPNKLHEYMASGRPIMLNVEWDDDVVSESGGAFVVPEYSPEAWGRAFVNFCEADPAEMSAMGERLRRRAEADYGFDRLGERLDVGLRETLSY